MQPWHASQEKLPPAFRWGWYLLRSDTVMNEVLTLVTSVIADCSMCWIQPSRQKGRRQFQWENYLQCWYKKPFMLTMVNVWSIMRFCVTKTLVQISWCQRTHWKKMKRQHWRCKDIKGKHNIWLDDEEVMMKSTICAMVCNLRCIWQSEMAFAIRDVAGNHEYGGGYWTDFI